MLKITKLKKNFGDLKVLKGIDLEVRPGEIVALVGTSGAGKSTLLRCINQIEEPTSGKVVLNDVDLMRGDKLAREMLNHIGMVFQQFNLFPHLTVLENIILAPTKVDHQSREVAVKNAKAILKKLGMFDKADVYPGSLSGGQQQRVAIARELAKNPDLMLFDEPTSALDPANVDGLAAIIKGLASEGMTIIVVSHDIRFALDTAKRVVFLDKGKVAADDSSEAIIETTNPVVYSFFQSALD